MSTVDLVLRLNFIHSLILLTDFFFSYFNVKLFFNVLNKYLYVMSIDNVLGALGLLLFLVNPHICYMSFVIHQSVNNYEYVVENMHFMLTVKQLTY